MANGGYGSDAHLDDLNVAPLVTASATSSSGMRQRCVAVTKDIALKGQSHWFNGLDVLTDTDGCENLVDRDFAKFELRLPIQTDVSHQANVKSQGVGGSIQMRPAKSSAAHSESPTTFLIILKATFVVILRPTFVVTLQPTLKIALKTTFNIIQEPTKKHSKSYKSPSKL